MSPRRRAAVGLWVALTFSFAVLVHGVIHAVGSGTFVWDSPAHVVMLFGALVLLAGIAGRLGFGGRASERRRRIALVRSVLGEYTAATAAIGVATQAAVAVLLFVAEGESLEPARLLPAILAGIVALLCSALIFRATRDRVVAFLIALAAPQPASLPRASLRRRVARLARTGVAHRLFVPTRPPPALAA